MITTKILGAVSALFASTSVLFLTLWLVSSGSLNKLEEQHKQLKQVAEDCSQSLKNTADSYESTLGIVKSLREDLSKVEVKTEEVVTNISTYKPTKCPTINPETGKTNEVDIDAPLDAEFIRVSEGNY